MVSIKELDRECLEIGKHWTGTVMPKGGKSHLMRLGKEMKNHKVVALER